MDWLFLVALALLLAGVLGSVLPLLPGVPLSLAGVYGYWWGTDFSEPGLLFVVGATVVGGIAVVGEYAAGAVSARMGGGSRWTAAAAAVVGLLALLVTGPLGMFVGVALAAFAVEFYRTRDARSGARTAAYAVVGLLASAIFQLVVTVSLLVGFLVAVL
ncbi:DUF456 domain-containing protein [Haladaptatus halobius]|jgi:uncharacterized protein|uniref:DUF456 domain-containing protein n=1 Tax=Haladaptatus halobius TaxID=2884875 RepID=UPI001D09D7EF|nr:DUF456 domain-containing protein [Haladaptatus halobius]